MIPVFPFGAATAASLMIRRRNEEEEKKKKVPTSRFVIKVDDENTVISPDVVNEFDWVRAAWALIRACEEKGLGSVLQKVIEEERT